MKLSVGRQESLAFNVIGAFDGCRVTNAPVSRHRLSRPERARLGGGLIADRKHELHRRRTRLSKFAPVFAAQAFGGKTVLFETLKRERIYAPGRMTPGTERFEFTL